MADEAEDLDLEQEAEQDGAASEEQHDEAEQTPAFDPEAVARLAGWAPKDEWKGDPADWKDAGAFLIDTAAVNKTLRKEQKRLRQDVDRITRTAERIVQSERQKALEQARAELRQAVEAGDTEAADAAAQRIERAVSTSTEHASTADEFAARQPWFGVHAEATGLAQVAAEKAFRAGQDAQGQFAAAEAAVRKRFPYLFEDETGEERTDQRQEQRAAPKVQGGQRTQRQVPKDPVASLSPEAKKAGEAFVRMSKGRMTLADYAKLYHEENA
jgi:ElaB/YqjD/DUF883 family membrane-anchored ribosome-binding protein